MLNIDLIIQCWPLLAKGIYLSLTLAVFGNLISLALGLGIALLRVEWFGKNRPLQALSVTWIELFRNVPLLLQVLFFYYVFQLDGYFSVLCGLCTYTSAFMAETYRAGFLTVPASEVRAGKLLGLKPLDLLRCVLLPRTMENSISSLGSQMMNLTKNTSISYFVAVGDMTYTFETLSGQTYHFIEFFLVALGTYAILCLMISALIGRLEKAFLKRYTRKAPLKAATLPVPQAFISLNETESTHQTAENKGELVYGA